MDALSDIVKGGVSAFIASSGTLFSNSQLGNIVTNTTAETQFTFQKEIVIPGGLLVPGSAIRVSQMGVYQAGATQAVQPRVRLGPAATSMTSRPVLLTTSGAVSGLLNAMTDTPWGADTVSLVMPDGSILSSGKLFYSTSMTAALNALVATTAPVTGIDLSVDNVLTASAQWTNASASNQIRATTMLVEILTLSPLASGFTYYDLSFPVAGKPAASERLLDHVAGRAFTLPAGLLGSQAKATTAPAASATFVLAKNGTQVGTVVFAAGATSGTFSAASAITLNPGDRLTLTAPATQDSALADLSFTFAGTR